MTVTGDGSGDELLRAVRGAQAALDEMQESLDEQSVRLRTSRAVQWVLGCVVVVVVVVCVALGLVVMEIQDSQMAGCERGNEFRADVLVAFDQNDQDFAEALAEVMGATPDRLAEFLTILRNSREVPDALLPVDCAEAY